jgi:hypothetical protein
MAFRQISASKARALAQSDERVETLETHARDLKTMDDFRDAIAEAWTQAQKRFISIGRYLIAAKERLAHGDYTALVERELPFNASIAFQLRAVAEAIDGGRVDEKELPPNYSILYQVTTLRDDELAMARQRGLIRPDVTRREIESFKRTVRPKEPTGAGSVSSPIVLNVDNTRHALNERRARLLDEIKRLQAELRTIDDEIAQHSAIDGTLTH